MCRVDQLLPGEARRVEVDPPIAVFNVGGEFWATDDTCTHGAFSLSEGYLGDDGCVECIGHMSRFCVRNGRAMTLPATEALRTHSTRVDDGIVYVLPRTTA